MRHVFCDVFSVCHVFLGEILGILKANDRTSLQIWTDMQRCGKADRRFLSAPLPIFFEGKILGGKRREENLSGRIGRETDGNPSKIRIRKYQLSRPGRSILPDFCLFPLGQEVPVFGKKTGAEKVLGRNGSSSGRPRQSKDPRSLV